MPESTITVRDLTRGGGVQVVSVGVSGPQGPGAGALLAANNLSDVPDKPTARTNLGAEAAGAYRPGGTDVPVVDGGTGASSASAARSNLGLSNVDNTSDEDKPVSTAQQTALDTKADASVLAIEITNRQTADRSAGIPELYLPTATASMKWRALRAEVLAGTRQGHVAVVGDSQEFGAAATGVTLPKYSKCWPGRLRTLVDSVYGSAGSGVVIADAVVRANPTYDPRWTFGSNVTDHAFGFHAASCFRLDAVSGTYVEFTAPCDEFWIWNLSDTGGFNTASIDGGAGQTFRNLVTGGAPTLERESGFHSNLIVTRVPAGTSGTHTLRITPTTVNAAYDCFLLAVEARQTGNGRFRVSNPSVNSKTLASLVASDEATALFGLPLVDALQADLLVIALGENDWQAARSIATHKTNLTTLIQRQRSSGNNAGGGAKAEGDVLLMWSPQPDLVTLNHPSPSWAEYRDAVYEVAEEQNCPLLDLSFRWQDFATADALNLVADTIHASDSGAADIANLTHRVIFNGL